jgi:hypothetical protein
MRIQLDTPLALSLPQHADQHRPKRPVLLAVNQGSAKARLCG